MRRILLVEERDFDHERVEKIARRLEEVQE